MKKLICFMLLMFPSLVFADQLLEAKTVKRIFSESQSTAGFYTVEGLPQCKFQIMYIRLSNSDGTPKESGRAQLSMVMAAKSAKWKIVRMDYTVDSGGSCRLTGLHTE
ncbi:hypothetical protein [Aliikangiella coralliicola]|uniref:Uncharacterized protein n=1 Tax=Aliikangiella coralliicola TaxID=2592383 RepID=A0A545UAR7_9GAMM|nr:hypothetical protein [Aliikangiella coralliicola]TQV86559.1 hypothetical protein FLL46_16775 [Aliikangiella coralliicola]